MSFKASFSDNGYKGKLALELSYQEKLKPFLICNREFDEDFYRDYDPKNDVYSGKIWYLEHVNKLKKVSKLTAFGIEYTIYEISNTDACLSIWQMASCDKAINTAIVSGNSQLHEILDAINENYYCTDKFIEKANCPWAYWLEYGGGSDENYACFETEDKKKYAEFLKLVNKFGLVITKES